MVSVVRLEKILKRKGALDRSAYALYCLSRAIAASPSTLSINAYVWLVGRPAKSTSKSSGFPGAIQSPSYERGGRGTSTYAGTPS